MVSGTCHGERHGRPPSHEAVRGLRHHDVAAAHVAEPQLREAQRPRLEGGRQGGGAGATVLRTNGHRPVVGTKRSQQRWARPTGLRSGFDRKAGGWTPSPGDTPLLFSGTVWVINF